MFSRLVFIMFSLKIEFMSESSLGLLLRASFEPPKDLVGVTGCFLIVGGLYSVTAVGSPSCSVLIYFVYAEDSCPARSSGGKRRDHHS